MSSPVSSKITPSVCDSSKRTKRMPKKPLPLLKLSPKGVSLTECNQLDGTPLKGSDWAASMVLEDGTLYLGECSDAADREGLKKHGITHVVNATSECCNLTDENGEWCPKYFNVKISDHCDAPIHNFFLSVAEFIEEARESGGKVLVHCRRGISRSSTLVLAYLMVLKGIGFDEAFDYLRSRRSQINPNIGFILTLQNFEKQAKVVHSLMNRMAQPSASIRYCRNRMTDSQTKSPCSVEWGAAEVETPTSLISSISSLISVH